MRRVYAKPGAASPAADLQESAIGKFRFRLIREAGESSSCYARIWSHISKAMWGAPGMPVATMKLRQVGATEHKGQELAAGIARLDRIDVFETLVFIAEPFFA